MFVKHVLSLISHRRQYYDNNFEFLNRLNHYHCHHYHNQEWSSCWQILASTQSPIAISSGCLFLVQFVNWTITQQQNQQSSPNLVRTWHLDLRTSILLFAFGVDGITDEVIRLKNRSNIRIAINPPMVELECRSKAQNVRNALVYLDSIPNFLWNMRCKCLPGPKNFINFENFETFNIVSISNQIWKGHMQIIVEKLYFIIVTSLTMWLRNDKVSL